MFTTATGRNGRFKMTSKRKLCQIVAIALVLTGCNGRYSFFNKDEPPPEPNIFPKDYRSKLLYFLQVQLTDPTGVREAFISEPKLQPIASENRYVACLRYDSKDGYGRYVGVKEYVAVYFNGSLTQFVPAAPGQCTGAAYVPFPELEKLKRQGT